MTEHEAPFPSVADRGAVLEQLARVLASSVFARSERSSAMLRYIVERTLDGDTDRLKEYTLGAEALGRGARFDPRTDPTVRAEASRLRERLARYYATDGAEDALVFDVPRGSYVSTIAARASLREPPKQAATTSVPAATTAAETSQAGAAHSRSRPGVATMILVAAAVLGIVTTAMIALRPRSGETDIAREQTPLQFEADLRADAALGSEVGPDFALAADGRQLVFVAVDSSGASALYVRRLAEPTAVRLPGTEGARVPFLSPDGRWVGFWALGQIKRTALDGGAPVVLCEATDLLGATWGTDGFIVAAINPTGKLWRIPEGGGAPTVLVDLTAERTAPTWPQLVAGGSAVVFTALGDAGADRAQVEAFSLRDGTRHVLAKGGTFGRAIDGGYLTYVNQGTLYATTFDTTTLEVRGPAVPLFDDVAYSRAFGFAQVDVARAGTLAYRRAAGGGRFTVASVGRNGQRSAWFRTAGRYATLSLSPDGKQLALSALESGVGELRIVEPGKNSVRRVRTSPAVHTGLTWSPDGRLLLFGGRNGLASVNPALPDSQTDRAVGAPQKIRVPWSFGTRAARVAWFEMDPRTSFDLWTAPITRTADSLQLGTPEPFLHTSAFEVYPAFSSDGQWIAYSSNESGRQEVYVRRFPDDGSNVRMSNDGGRVPRWSPNGRELLYQTDDQRVFVVSFRVAAGKIVPATPQQWGSEPIGDTGVYPGFDVLPDGEHIVALVPAALPAELPARNHVTFVLNFRDEVARRVAAARRER